MESLKIEWETGYMVLNVRAFFPTTDKKSRKIARFINHHCKKEAVAELVEELYFIAERLRLEAEDCKDSASKAVAKSHIEHLAKQARICEASRKRLIRDIKNIEGGMS